MIPDGSNWKVTLLLEFPDPEQRRVALGQLIDVEDRCWVQVGDQARVFAVPDEDLERENDEKTSAVHFLRFELSPTMTAAVRSGAPIGLGVDHDAYRHAVSPLPAAVRNTQAADID